MLLVRDLHIKYGDAEILHGISLEVQHGAMITLIGANGAGKTTTLKAISGLIRPTEGIIEFEGMQINGKRPDEIIGLGISHCPEGRRVFPDMTVLENLQLGGYVRQEELKRNMTSCFDLFPVLHDRRKQLAGTLSGGEQQMLAIARSLMCNPRLLMFDEPSMGLAPNLVERVAEIIMNINHDGTTVLLVEQNAFMALEMAQHAYVMETGEIALSGEATDMLKNEYVKKAYLGR